MEYIILVSWYDMAEVAVDPIQWFMSVPVVSRCYLGATLATTAACFMGIVSPLTLYYNFDLIVSKGQYWRVFSSFFFFGPVGLDFVLHLYFVVVSSTFLFLLCVLLTAYHVQSRYCLLLEEGIFRNRPADFTTMLIFGALLMFVLSYSVPTFATIKFLAHPLTFMMIYIWGRSPENVHVRLSFFGVLVFRAPYLPWAMLMMSFFFGNPIETDLLGIVAGHMYYFLEFVYPAVAAARGWRVRRILRTPSVLKRIFGQNIIEDELGGIEVRVHYTVATMEINNDRDFYSDYRHP